LVNKVEGGVFTKEDAAVLEKLSLDASVVLKASAFYREARAVGSPVKG